MEENGNKYQTANDIYYPGVIDEMLKNIHGGDASYMRPIFEALTNAFESLMDKKNTEGVSLHDNRVTLSLYTKSAIYRNDPRLDSFNKLVIADTGIGFNDAQFERFNKFRDTRKGHSNRGTGRLQYVLTFGMTTVKSTYKDSSSSTGYKKRTFSVSKKWANEHNAIVRLDENSDVNAIDVLTEVSFEQPIDGGKKIQMSQFCDGLSTHFLKQAICAHYIPLFGAMIADFPTIELLHYSNGALQGADSLMIKREDVFDNPAVKSFDVPYSSFKDGSVVQSSENKEHFALTAFRVDEEKLPTNQIRLVSKNETVDTDIRLPYLSDKVPINGCRYLFLLSSDFIDNRDVDTRGQIHIYRRDEFVEQFAGDMFSEELLLDDIESCAAQGILSLCPEILDVKKERDSNIDDLRKMFLLDRHTLDTLNVPFDATDESVLSKLYAIDAKNAARKDAEIRRLLQDLTSFRPDKRDEHQKKMNEAATRLSRLATFRGRDSLVQYVARRRLVLELFGKILNNELDNTRSSGHIDEKLLHNLIFQQSSNDPSNSDLWLINEDFIYFKGCSEEALNSITYNGEKIFREDFNEEEARALTSIGENRLEKRPDILLFPDDGKCIIIEFKASNVNVAKHLSQIDDYATILLNYTKDKFAFTQYYGYLIGEAMERRDIVAKPGNWIESPKFHYFFHPARSIPYLDEERKRSGELYTEVIKYSTLLERAKLRNKIFIQKLGIDCDD